MLSLVLVLGLLIGLMWKGPGGLLNAKQSIFKLLYSYFRISKARQYFIQLKR